MKKVFFIFLVIALSLTSCGVSKEAKSVMEKIDALPEITLECKDLLDEIDVAYSALSDEDKKQITNLTTLEEAKEQYQTLKNEEAVKKLDDSIRALGKLFVSDRSELDDAINAINFQYSALDEELKSQVTSYQKLDSYISKSVAKSVSRLSKNLQPFLGEMLLNSYGNYLNDRQKLTCLGDVGLYSCIADAKQTLERINSGKVFDITKITASCTDKMGEKIPYQDGENQVEGTFEISGTNYFGGPYTQTVKLFYTFNIDVEECSLDGVSGITY